MTDTAERSMFYRNMGFVMIALLLGGFVPALAARYGAGGSLSPILMAHSVTFFSWYLLFPYQASLIADRNIKQHKTIGKLIVVLVAVMWVLTYFATRESFASGSNGGTPFTPEHFIILPSMDFVKLPIFFGLALYFYKNGQAHKRFMLLMGVMLMDPGVARIGMHLGIMPLGLVLHFGLLFALVVFDRRTLGAIHFATKIGIAFLIARYFTLFVIGPTETWASFAHMIYG